ncbi:MAG: macro domain-containing protein [Euryarchaeota archaeon]|nr:macro domain-containing protein [Euryarchaeota archaeon]
MKKTKNDVIIECIKGDIVSQKDLAAVVNAANAQLRMGGGVAGAIHRAAGPGLEKECQPIAPITPGEAVITCGYELPNAYVIHCLGPVYGRDKPEDKILAKCYRNALKRAEEHEIDSVGFPAISTGAFGYPLRDAARVALGTVLEICPTLQHVKRIRFVLHNQRVLKIHNELLLHLIKEK